MRSRIKKKRYYISCVGGHLACNSWMPIEWMTHLSALALQLPSRPVVIRETFSGWKILSGTENVRDLLNGRYDRTFFEKGREDGALGEGVTKGESAING